MINPYKQKDIQKDIGGIDINKYPATMHDVLLSHKHTMAYNKRHKNPIKDNLDYAIKRTEKILTAVYMITSLMSDMEPIKKTLRDKNIELLLELTAIRRSVVEGEFRPILNIIGLIDEILFFLDLSKSMNIISGMNFSILHDECFSLKDFITRDGIEKTDDIFIKEILDGREKKAESKTYHKGHNKTNNVFFNGHKGHNRLRDRIIKDTKYVSNVELEHKVANKDHVMNRAQAIINIIKQMKEVTIKDISSVIDDCSEKTVQRELMSLIKKNIIKKEGEKRWSRYSLVS